LDGINKDVAAFLKKGLTYLVQGSMVQILGLESGFIKHAVAWIILADAMLLNQLHARPPIP
jgi:hypothetical protein